MRACVYIAYINGTGGVTVKGSIDTILLSCQIAKNNDWCKQAETGENTLRLWKTKVFYILVKV